MPRVLVPLAEGFEEIECSTLVDVLRRGGVDVVLAGVDGEAACRGSRGISFVPDMSLGAAEGPWDLVVLPGGLGGTERMLKCPPLRELLQQRAEAQEPIAAICAAPLVLDDLGLLPPGSFTCHPGVAPRVVTEGRTDDRVVDAGFILTSQGPGTAMEFALHLVEKLMGTEKMSEVRGPLVTR